MIATISLMLCGFLAFTIHNSICFIQAKKKLSPYAPRISQYFFKNRKFILFGLIGLGLLLSVVVFGIGHNKAIEWNAIKVRTVALGLFVYVLITIVIIFTIHKLYKQLACIENYAYMHHATQLQHQSKIDYTRTTKKIISNYLSGYSIWFFLVLVIIYF